MRKACGLIIFGGLFFLKHYWPPIGPSMIFGHELLMSSTPDYKKRSVPRALETRFCNFMMEKIVIPTDQWSGQYGGIHFIDEVWSELNLQCVLTLYRSGYTFGIGPKGVGDLNFSDGSDNPLQAPLEAVLGQRPLHSLKGKSLLWQFSVNRAGRGASWRLCCHLKS